MSLAHWHFLKMYASWREAYLTKYPEKRLFPWVAGLIEDIPEMKESIITLTPKSVEIIEEAKNKGILAVLAVAVVLALADSK